MANTIEDALEAPKAGKLHEAEIIYRILLQNQQQHQDKNHNLDILATSVNKLITALPLLETSIKANSIKRQFWII